MGQDRTGLDRTGQDDKTLDKGKEDGGSTTR